MSARLITTKILPNKEVLKRMLQAYGATYPMPGKPVFVNPDTQMYLEVIGASGGKFVVKVYHGGCNCGEG